MVKWSRGDWRHFHSEFETFSLLKWKHAQGEGTRDVDLRARPRRKNVACLARTTRDPYYSGLGWKTSFTFYFVSSCCVFNISWLERVFASLVHTFPSRILPTALFSGNPNDFETSSVSPFKFFPLLYFNYYSQYQYSPRITIYPSLQLINCISSLEKDYQVAQEL